MSISTFLRKRIVNIALLIAGGLILIQFIRPGIKNPPVTKDLQVPPDVAHVLRVSCYDCHSNETKLKWFDKIAPASWLVAGHIRDGRKALNFSHWDSLSAGDQKASLFLSVNQAMLGEMPLSSYTTFHGEARLTEKDINTLKTYVGGLAPVKVSDTSRITVAQQQFSKWAAGALPAVQAVQPAPNGIAYIHDYRDWQIVNISDRFDNGTMRVILGNDVAIQAINRRQTNPWPNGTIFAKVAWEQLTDSNLVANTGELKQVEFMIKDDKKYAGTAGWGWARWKGNELKPYGKTLTFTQECVSCHQPMKGNDFVFTPTMADADRPDKVVNGAPLQLITSVIDNKRRTHTVLFGNAIAVQHARSGAAGAYPAGAILTLATWSQQEDAHWFGAKIPQHLQTVETVKVGKTTTYEGHQAPSWKQLPAADHTDRINYMTHLKASVIFN